ncbi:MAG: BACON domain-containing protein, partial [Alistipes sp.]|nr:BACON domain-containing protein [Alistipes sp.]
MRNLAHKIVFLLITFFAIASCADKGEEFVPTLAITASDGSALDGRTIVVASEGGTNSFQIKSNAKWSIGCKAEWLKFSHAEGEGEGDADITFTANATESARSAVVVVYIQDNQQVRLSFNIIQHAPSIEQPEDNP